MVTEFEQIRRYHLSHRIPAPDLDRPCPRRNDSGLVYSWKPQMLNVLIGTLTLLLAGNALGATWALFALADRWNAPWMALVIPLLLNGLLHFNQHPRGWWRALLCLLGLWVAIVQCNFIVGGALVAAHLGKPLWPWLLMVGPEMAFAVARAHLDWIHLLAYAVGTVLALWLGYGRRIAAGRPRARRAA